MSRGGRACRDMLVECDCRRVGVRRSGISMCLQVCCLRVRPLVQGEVTLYIDEVTEQVLCVALVSYPNMV